MRLRGLVVALALSLPTAVFAQWTPPIGIPAPDFGIAQVTPAAGVPVSSLPPTMQPGSIAQLTGTSDSPTLTCLGTLATPCWVLGGTLTGTPHILGSYTILDHVTLADAQLEIGGDHVVIRNSELIGAPSDPTSAGIYVTGTNALVWRNHVHDRGDLTSATDTDAHGISVVRNARNVWILDNETDHCAGDGINVNSYPYDATGFTAISHVYIGRNFSHDNKQTSFWAKQSQDVIFSQNEAANERVDPNGFSYGQCLGYQYATQRVWYLFNDIHDCAVGIGVSSDDIAGAPSTSSYFVGNRLTRIGVPDPTVCGVGGPWPCAAIRLTNSGIDYVVGNVIVGNTNDALHATGGSLYTDLVGVTVSEDTAAAPVDVYAAFTALYGIDITGGIAPTDGTVGLTAPPPAPAPAPTPTPVPTPKPTPPPMKPPCSSNPIVAFFQRLLGRC